MSKFYAVRVGKCPGIYTSWDACAFQVRGFSGAEYKAFKTKDEARAFLGEKVEQLSFDLGEDIICDTLFDLEAYVDGSYNRSTMAYGYGCVILYKGVEVTRMHGCGHNEEDALMNNVAGELLGSIQAIEYGIEQGYKGITLYYDYEGIEKWAKGLWKTNRPGTIQYAKDIQRLCQSIEISFVKVTAHSGDTYNDIADMLAKQAVGIQ